MGDLSKSRLSIVGILSLYATSIFNAESVDAAVSNSIQHLDELNLETYWNIPGSPCRKYNPQPHRPCYTPVAPTPCDKYDPLVPVYDPPCGRNPYWNDPNDPLVPVYDPVPAPTSTTTPCPCNTNPTTTTTTFPKDPVIPPSPPIDPRPIDDPPSGIDPPSTSSPAPPIDDSDNDDGDGDEPINSSSFSPTPIDDDTTTSTTIAATTTTRYRPRRSTTTTTTTTVPATSTTSRSSRRTLRNKRESTVRCENGCLSHGSTAHLTTFDGLTIRPRASCPVILASNTVGHSIAAPAYELSVRYDEGCGAEGFRSAPLEFSGLCVSTVELTVLFRDKTREVIGFDMKQGVFKSTSYNRKGRKTRDQHTIYVPTPYKREAKQYETIDVKSIRPSYHSSLKQADVILGSGLSSAAYFFIEVPSANIKVEIIPTASFVSFCTGHSSNKKGKKKLENDHDLVLGEANDEPSLSSSHNAPIVSGLCGLPNGNPWDDLIYPNGTVSSIGTDAELWISGVQPEDTRASSVVQNVVSSWMRKDALALPSSLNSFSTLAADRGSDEIDMEFTPELDIDQLHEVGLSEIQTLTAAETDTSSFNSGSGAHLSKSPAIPDPFLFSNDAYYYAQSISRNNTFFNAFFDENSDFQEEGQQATESITSPSSSRSSKNLLSKKKSLESSSSAPRDHSWTEVVDVLKIRSAFNTNIAEGFCGGVLPPPIAACSDPAKKYAAKAVCQAIVDQSEELSQCRFKNPALVDFFLSSCTKDICRVCSADTTSKANTQRQNVIATFLNTTAPAKEAEASQVCNASLHRSYLSISASCERVMLDFTPAISTPTVSFPPLNTFLPPPGTYDLDNDDNYDSGNSFNDLTDSPSKVPRDFSIPPFAVPANPSSVDDTVFDDNLHLLDEDDEVNDGTNRTRPGILLPPIPLFRRSSDGNNTLGDGSCTVRTSPTPFFSSFDGLRHYFAPSSCAHVLFDTRCRVKSPRPGVASLRVSAGFAPCRPREGLLAGMMTVASPTQNKDEDGEFIPQCIASVLLDIGLPGPLKKLSQNVQSSSSKRKRTHRAVIRLLIEKERDENGYLLHDWKQPSVLGADGSRIPAYIPSNGEETDDLFTPVPSTQEGDEETPRTLSLMNGRLNITIARVLDDRKADSLSKLIGEEFTPLQLTVQLATPHGSLQLDWQDGSRNLDVSKTGDVTTRRDTGANLTLRVSENYIGRTCGLCGSLDNSPLNEFVTPQCDEADLLTAALPREGKFSSAADELTRAVSKKWFKSMRDVIQRWGSEWALFNMSPTVSRLAFGDTQESCSHLHAAPWVPANGTAPSDYESGWDVSPPGSDGYNLDSDDILMLSGKCIQSGGFLNRVFKRVLPDLDGAKRYVSIFDATGSPQGAFPNLELYRARRLGAWVIGVLYDDAVPGTGPVVAWINDSESVASIQKHSSKMFSVPVDKTGWNIWNGDESKSDANVVLRVVSSIPVSSSDMNDDDKENRSRSIVLAFALAARRDSHMRQAVLQYCVSPANDPVLLAECSSGFVNDLRDFDRACKAQKKVQDAIAVSGIGNNGSLYGTGGVVDDEDRLKLFLDSIKF